MKTCAICLDEFDQLFQACSKESDSLCQACWLQIIPPGKRGLLLTEQIRCEMCKESIDAEKLPEEIRKQIESIRLTIPKTSSPQSIGDFNYQYDDQGVLRHCQTNEQFVFISQRHYNQLGICIEKYIQELMRTSPWNYREIWLPEREEQSTDHFDQVNIFTSEDFLTNENGCLILIQGSGVVRPGQWARSCCINESLDIGAMFPYMKKAREHNLSVIILNPNQTSYVENEVENEDLVDAYLSSAPLPKRSTKKIPGLATNREHILYVYENFISKCPAKTFFFVAHSAGGDGLMYLLRKCEEKLLGLSMKIAFTDSVHSILPCESENLVRFLKTNAIHFVASDEPMGQSIERDYNFSRESACPEVSAGHPKHEYTSGSCVDGVFEFFFPPEESIQKTKF